MRGGQAFGHTDGKVQRTNKAAKKMAHATADTIVSALAIGMLDGLLGHKALKDHPKVKMAMATYMTANVFSDLRMVISSAMCIFHRSAALV